METAQETKASAYSKNLTIVRKEILDTGADVARADGMLDHFRHLAQIPIDICPRNGTIRYDGDMSLPKHSVLVTMSKPNGDFFYQLGICRHEDGDGVRWSTHS